MSFLSHINDLFFIQIIQKYNSFGMFEKIAFPSVIEKALKKYESTPLTAWTIYCSVSKREYARSRFSQISEWFEQFFQSSLVTSLKRLEASINEIPQTIFYAIVKHEHPELLVDALITLPKVNLLEKEDIKIFCRYKKEELFVLNKLIVILADKQLLTPLHFTLITKIKRSDLTESLVYCLERLSKSELLNEENLFKLLSHKNYRILNIILRILRSNELLILPNFNKVMEEKDSFIMTILRNILQELSDLRLLTQELFDAVLKMDKLVFRNVLYALGTDELRKSEAQNKFINIMCRKDPIRAAEKLAKQAKSIAEQEKKSTHPTVPEIQFFKKDTQLCVVEDVEDVDNPTPERIASTEVK